MPLEPGSGGDPFGAFHVRIKMGSFRARCPDWGPRLTFWGFDVRMGDPGVQDHKFCPDLSLVPANSMKNTKSIHEDSNPPPRQTFKDEYDKLDH